MWGAGGLVHPRTSIGGGARREAVGGAGVERSETESPRYPTPIPTKKEGNSLLSHLRECGRDTNYRTVIDSIVAVAEFCRWLEDYDNIV